MKTFLIEASFEIEAVDLKAALEWIKLNLEEAYRVEICEGTEDAKTV